MLPACLASASDKTTIANPEGAKAGERYQNSDVGRFLPEDS